MKSVGGRFDSQLKLRLANTLKEKIKKEALINGRSINSEILVRLIYTFKMETDNQKRI